MPSSKRSLEKFLKRIKIAAGSGDEWKEGALYNWALAAGETVALSCQYGAGRSGVIAAWLLIGCGLAAADAIALVRAHFPEAIENRLQERWLLDVEKVG